MKTRSIGYWAATGLVAFAFAFGGVIDLSHGKEVLEGMSHLGYPAYVATLLGVWKILGAIAIVAPGMPRLKEFAYAGILFDLTGAAFSHAMSGDPAGKVATPLVILAIAAASYVLRPERRVLGAPLVAPASGRAPRATPAPAT
jgi:hypothetical protein